MWVDGACLRMGEQLVYLVGQFASPAVPAPVEFGLGTAFGTVDVESDPATATAQISAGRCTARNDTHMTALNTLSDNTFGLVVAVAADRGVLPPRRGQVGLSAPFARFVAIRFRCGLGSCHRPSPCATHGLDPRRTPPHGPDEPREPASAWRPQRARCRGPMRWLVPA